MNETKDYSTRDTSLVGAARVHAVVSELSLRGLIALPTIRSTDGVDVIVSNKAGQREKEGRTLIIKML